MCKTVDERLELIRKSVSLFQKETNTTAHDRMLLAKFIEWQVRLILNENKL
jgi:hypothetical protein